MPHFNFVSVFPCLFRPSRSALFCYPSHHRRYSGEESTFDVEISRKTFESYPFVSNNNNNDRIACATWDEMLMVRRIGEFFLDPYTRSIWYRAEDYQLTCWMMTEINRLIHERRRRRREKYSVRLPFTQSIIFVSDVRLLRYVDIRSHMENMRYDISNTDNVHSFERLIMNFISVGFVFLRDDTYVGVKQLWTFESRYLEKYQSKITTRKEKETMLSHHLNVANRSQQRSEHSPPTCVYLICALIWMVRTYSGHGRTVCTTSK